MNEADCHCADCLAEREAKTTAACAPGCQCRSCVDERKAFVSRALGLEDAEASNVDTDLLAAATLMSGALAAGSAA